MRLLSDKDLHERGIRFSRQHRDKLITQGKFPRPVKLGTGPTARNAWAEEEIDAYVQARIAARDGEAA